MTERRERVVLELVDDFSPGMVKAAAATAILNRELKSVSGQSVGASRGLDGVDTAARRADTSLRRVETTMVRARNNDRDLFTRAATGADGFIGKLGLIPAVSIAAGAALIPLGAAAAGVAAAFAAPIVFVGGGVTLFSLLGGAAIAETKKQYTAIDQLQTKLAGLTKDTKEYVQVQHQLHAAQAAISPQQREFHDSLESLESDFAKFIRGPGGQDLLAPFTQGLQVADDLLPAVRPIIHAVSDDLTGLLGELDKYASTPGFDRFVHAVADQIGPDLKTFGHIVGDVTPGIGHLLLILGRRLSPELLAELSRLGREFSAWAQSKGARQDVASFIQYVHEVGPDAAHTVEAVAQALGHVGHALAPLGPPVLHFIQGIATAISSIPIPVLTKLAGAAVALTAFQKFGGFKVAGAISKLASRGGGVGGALGGGLAKYGGVTPVYVVNAGFGGTGGKFPPIAPFGGPGGGPFVPWAGALSRFAPKVPLAPTLALGAGAVAGGLQTFDILKRASLSPHALAPGVLTPQALQSSRLGEAQGLFGPNIKGPDPHVRIDYDRLAASIRKYGDESKYAQKIQAELQSGFNISKGFLGFGTSDADKAVGGLHDLNVAIAAAGHGWHAVASGPVQVMNDHLERQSRELELVGHSVDRAFGVASASKVENLAGKVNKITGVKAEQAFDLIGHSAQRNTAAAGSDVDGLGGKIRALPDKTVKVTADTRQALEAARQVSAALAAIRSKTITVTTLTTTGGHVKAGGYATGGFTGMGRRDEPAGIVHRREVVIPENLVRRDWGMLKSRYGHLPGFATGGLAGGGGASTGPDTDPAVSRLKRLQQALDDDTQALDDHKSKLGQLISAEHTYAQGIAQQFRTDLFATSSPWGQGSPTGILRGDIAHARAFNRDLHTLAKKGVNGNALSLIAQSGNLQAAQMLAAEPRGDLRQYEHLVRLRNRVTGNAGQYAAGQRSGDEISGVRQEIRQTNRRLDKLHRDLDAIRQDGPKNADRAGDRVNGNVNRQVRDGQRRRRQ